MKKLITLLLFITKISSFAFSQTNPTNMVGAWQQKDTVGGKVVQFRNSSTSLGITKIVTPATLSDSLRNSKIEFYIPSKTYKKNEKVISTINGQTYLFNSDSDNNSTKPMLTNFNQEAWDLKEGLTYVGTWSAGAYTSGQVVDRTGTAYWCLSDNSTDPILLNPPDWIKLGTFEGLFSTVHSPYLNGDVVIDASNNVYVSNIQFNSYPLNYGNQNKWVLINGIPFSVAAWGDSLTAGAWSTGDSNYVTALSNIININIFNGGVPGETSTQIKTRFLADTAKWRLPTIFWVGRNNYNDTATVKADLTEMISKLPHDRYLVLGIIKATSDAIPNNVDYLNAYFEETYGERFVDLQKYLLTIYNPLNTQDVIDHNNGVIAWSLRSDWLHLNNYGYETVAKYVANYTDLLFGKTGDVAAGNITGKSIQLTGVDLDYSLSSLELFKAGDVTYIQGYDRINDVPLPTSIGAAAGSEIRLNQGGGVLKSGPITAWSSGLLYPLVKNGITGIDEVQTITTGSLTSTDITVSSDGGNLLKGDVTLTLPNINSNVGTYNNLTVNAKGQVTAASNVNYVDDSGLGITNTIPKFTGSSVIGNSIIKESSGKIGINTTTFEDGFDFTSPSFALGNYSEARIYGGSLSPTEAYMQVRDLSVPRVLKFFSSNVIFDSGVTATGFTGSGASLTDVVNSITGTTNQVVASGSTGSVTLSLPQSIATTSSPQFSRLGLGLAASANHYLTTAANTSTIGSWLWTPSSTDYTGTVSGTFYNNANELKFYDGTISGTNRLVKTSGNALYTGTGVRALTSNATGDIAATTPIIEQFNTDSDVITAITGATYNKANTFTATITPASSKTFYKGQLYKSSTYLYVATADNVSYRVPLYSDESGWASYVDNQYTSGSPLSISSGTTVTLTNNAATVINSNLPVGVTAFYNSSTSKITPASVGDSYSIAIRFKAKSSSASDYFDFGIDIGGSVGVIFKQTKSFLKGANTEMSFDIETSAYALSTFLANGGLVKLTAGTGTMTVYDIVFDIFRTHKGY